MPEAESFHEGFINGFLHRPDGPARNGIVLTHGAGGNCQAPLLVALSNAFAVSGFYVLRCDLPFRQKRRSGPPFPAEATEDRAGLASAVITLRNIASGRIFLGGHSYGGRQASILVSEDPQIADGLLLLSYPLHPPKKPDNLRTGHFSELRLPCLFVHGTNDPFGSIGEMKSWAGIIPGPAEISVIEGAGHDLARGKFDLPRLVIEPFRNLTNT
jgi:predicted alpha/beta-hydrolase family hydrolase